MFNEQHDQTEWPKVKEKLDQMFGKPVVQITEDEWAKVEALRKAATTLGMKLAAIRQKSQDVPTWAEEHDALRAALEAFNTTER